MIKKDEISDLAARIFESRELADEWLSTALPALGGNRPIDLCDTFEGRDLVRAAPRRARSSTAIFLDENLQDRAS